MDAKVINVNIRTVSMFAENELYLREMQGYDVEFSIKNMSASVFIESDKLLSIAELKEKVEDELNKSLNE